MISSLRNSVLVARHDFALLRRDPLAVILLIGMPLVVIAFLRSAYAPVLRQEHHPGANGAEQVVPGIAVMFAVFITTFVGIAFFREHIWGTWDRLRSLPLRSHELVLGKVAMPFVMLCIQQAFLFGIGAILFGLRVKGSVAALIAVDLAYSIWLMAFAFLITALSGTFQQLLAISNMGAIVLGGIGGALTPYSTLPGWTKAIAPATPSYWAMRAFNRIVLDGRGFAAAAASLAVLLGSAAVLALLTARIFRFSAVKGGTL